ncbi:hypothetical protein AKO1_003444, partial [Acrasis kona]
MSSDTEAYHASMARMFSLELKNKGNSLYSGSDYMGALEKYNEGIEAIDKLLLQYPNSKINFTAERAVLYSNKALCLIKLKRYEDVVKTATFCVQIDPGFGKGYLHLGMGYGLLGDYRNAIDTYNMGKKLQRMDKPVNVKIYNAAIEECEQHLSELQQFSFDFTEELPPEVCQLIFTYLDPSSLINCELVSTTFKEYARQKRMWKEHCQKRWLGKQCKEFQMLFQGAIVEKHWKLYYFEAERYSRRTTIKEQELCSFNWSFTASFVGSNDIEPVFGRDHVFRSQLTNEPLKWRILYDGKMVQVHEYPPLLVSRLPDWGFQMTNDYV